MSSEPWLEGPLEGVPLLVQPLFFSFAQVRNDLAQYTAQVSEKDVWRPLGSIPALGFQLRHLAGSAERLTTYLFGEQLSPKQLDHLKREHVPGATRAELLESVDETLRQIEERLRALDPGSLYEPRFVGRERKPTTVIGLLMHIAEHSQRHLGQAITTAKLLSGL
jgi:uncharacterized damage-inducible protein DinB